MSQAQIYLSIAPLSQHEAAAAANAVAALDTKVVRLIRQPLAGGMCLAAIEAERAVRHESPVWCLERLAAGIWNELGRYTRITANWQEGEEEDEMWWCLEEADYRRIMSSFRLTARRRV
ncbi:hypothetical protein GCM10007860_15210 [Chitiniphilus shinanonensis]|uniref:Uncharacterized protein n=1 Tax=Chitiniphilus shinanonensis TaxID=553088 RepID=A0ABQ6BX54_9NEIS|nr:hypothetical protein [Chitiniphilus shinanonensis]GLS04374.1 hypothetical protein GCM10007860_15210 [Chitiniphilus shinanonensis]